ncbi:RIIa domain-containing protein 1 [Gouania willdenowi]|uniref:RIIa domain-containing protein n=1 Tax=Gouania willdenowi TaxID=441366 RepID=A0A8C5GD87_GOUWI|nr:RIIa domain-containing protein 1 [Gouania willdenowi]
MAGKEGSKKLNYSVLSAEQQEKLQQFKLKTRIDNEKYMRCHPEIDLLIGDFIRNVLHKRPADIREFAADHFTKPDLLKPTGSKTEGNVCTD